MENKPTTKPPAMSQLEAELHEMPGIPVHTLWFDTNRPSGPSLPALDKGAGGVSTLRASDRVAITLLPKMRRYRVVVRHGSSGQGIDGRTTFFIPEEWATFETMQGRA